MSPLRGANLSPHNIRMMSEAPTICLTFGHSCKEGVFCKSLKFLRQLGINDT